ncbi:MAG: hypothetical protein ACK5LC_08090 [Coprobacillaceae bacterium]
MKGNPVLKEVIDHDFMETSNYEEILNKKNNKNQIKWEYTIIVIAIIISILSVHYCFG